MITIEQGMRIVTAQINRLAKPSRSEDDLLIFEVIFATEIIPAVEQIEIAGR